MIEYQDTLEFNADMPILVMDKLCKNYQLGSSELRVLREIDLTIHGGEYVAIAHALGNDPLIILAAEPTGNLDSASGADILAILDHLHGEGKTLIVVTHDEHIAAKAERIIQLFDGWSQEKSDKSLRNAKNHLHKKEA